MWLYCRMYTVDRLRCAMPKCWIVGSGGALGNQVAKALVLLLSDKKRELALPQADNGGKSWETMKVDGRCQDVFLHPSGCRKTFWLQDFRDCFGVNLIGPFSFWGLENAYCDDDRQFSWRRRLLKKKNRRKEPEEHADECRRRGPN